MLDAEPPGLGAFVHRADKLGRGIERWVGGDELVHGADQARGRPDPLRRLVPAEHRRLIWD